ncbi:MAG: R3H domain-containing nucleic acid-binding protein [Candidatus Paceibacterota bacterium]|jgi:spoIIIJ-associated protein
MNEDTIKTISEEFLNSLPFEYHSITISTDESGRFWVSIETKDSRHLIGRDGDVLASLNHLLNKVVEKKNPENEAIIKHVTVDINGYQKQKQERLKTLAHMMAERAIFFKANVELDPMSSYERLIIHDFLASRTGISTESAGEGRDRRVVIKYKE